MTVRNLRSAVAGIQQNRRVRAIALEVINGKASVKLAGSSQLLYGLSITGGTIVAGQEVYIDYTTGTPVVHSYQEDSPSSSFATRTKVRQIIKDPDVPYSNEFTEAPIDGILYGRQNACWVEITTTGSLNDLLDVNTGSATDGQALVYDADTGLWGPGTVAADTSGSTTVLASIVSKVMFSIDDVLSSGSNPLRIYNASGLERVITDVFVSLDTPSSGSTPVIIDIKKDGLSIFSGDENKPTLTSGSYTTISSAIASPVWSDGEYLTMNVDSIGNEYAGKNLVVQVIYSVSNIPVTHDGFTVVNPSMEIIEQDFFSIEGTISTGSSPIRIYNTTGSSLTISKIFLSLAVPTSGSPLVVDILKNGSSIFTSEEHKPSITTGSETGQTTDIDEATWADGEYLIMNVEQIGNAGGEDLVVQVIYSKNASSGESTIVSHSQLIGIGTNTHDQIDIALARLANTSGSNTGDQDLSGYLTDADSDGYTYGRKNGDWSKITSSGSGGGIEEAPIDGKQYARKDADWAEITSGSGGGIEEAPNDGKQYGRQSLGWTEITSGSGPSFDMTTISNLVLWLKAGVGITSSSGLVSQWNDQSTSGSHAVQATAGYKPLLIALPSNYPAIAFDGIDDYLYTPLILATGANPRTIVVAYKAMYSSGGGSYQHIIHYGTKNTNQAYGITSRTNGASIGNHYWSNNFASIAWGECGAGVLIIQYDGTTDYIYWNGILVGSYTVALNTGSDYGISIGSRIGAPYECGRFWVYEIACFSKFINASELSSINTGLMNKFGI